MKLTLDPPRVEKRNETVTSDEKSSYLRLNRRASTIRATRGDVARASVSPRAGTKHAHASKHTCARAHTHTHMHGVMRVSRTALQREHTGACLYVSQASECLLRRRLAARSRVRRVSMHAQIRSIVGIHHAKVSTCTHLISTNPELSDRNVSRQSRFQRPAGFLSNGIIITAVYSFERRRKEEETSIMRHERSCTTEERRVRRLPSDRIFRDR